MQVSYDTVLGIALNHCGLPPRVDSGGNSTLSHSLWDSFRIWINNRLYSYWNRVDLPFNRIEETLTVKNNIIPYDQTVTTDEDLGRLTTLGVNIGRVLSIKKDGADIPFYPEPHLIHFGSFAPEPIHLNDDPESEFDVFISYIKQSPVFSNRFTTADHDSNEPPFESLIVDTRIKVGDNAFATDDGHYYQVNTILIPQEDHSPERVNLTAIKLDIPEELADILGHAVAADFFHRNENQQQSRSHEARAELIWTQRLQQLITATPQRKRRRWIAADR